MFLLGHVGITATAARGADEDVDLRLAALLAIAPDLLDKPVALLFPLAVHENTRNFGHSWLGAAAALLLLLAFRRRVKRPLLYWACYLGHLVLDHMWMWSNPRVLLWPFAGPFPPPLPRGHLRTLVLAYNVAGEALGAALVARLSRRHGLSDPERFRRFLDDGRAPA